MNGAVACGHIETAKVAKEILLAGGNAFDAAIASLCAMFVTEPCMASFGGGGFALIRKENQIHQFDFFCQTPQHKTDSSHFKKVEVDFGDSKETYYAGHPSVAVPGIPAFIQQLHEQLATMPLRDLLQPAIQLAKEGVALNWFQNYDIHLLREFFTLQPDRSAHLFTEAGNVKPIGAIIQMPELASTLDFIALDGIQDFYRGDIAQLFFKEHQANYGSQTPEDWRNYESKWSKPLQFQWQNQMISTVHLPSIGGWLQRSFLSHLNSTDIKPKSNAHLQALIYAFKNEASTRRNKEQLEHRFPELKQKVQWQNLVNQGTSHFNIVDKQNNAICLTTTVGSGSGMYIGETGIYLNNMLGEEGLMPNGINSWKPNTRLFSSTCPTIATNLDNQTVTILGSGGSTRIPYAIAQVLFTAQLKHTSLADAIEMPRVFDDLTEVQIEPGFDNENDQLGKIWANKSLYFGGVHAISMQNKTIKVAADSRREGYAEVW